MSSSEPVFSYAGEWAKLGPVEHLVEKTLAFYAYVVDRTMQDSPLADNPLAAALAGAYFGVQLPEAIALSGTTDRNSSPDVQTQEDAAA